MAELGDPELEAIQQILQALEALDVESRGRVVAYVFQRLGIQGGVAGASRPTYANGVFRQQQGPVSTASDIRSLAALKQPRNLVDRVTLVAYYLAEVAPEGDRKAEITGPDLTKYFKQADFPIPSSTRGALFAARNAGYLDVGSRRGAYRLNPVGHNRVVHSLPEGRRRPRRPSGPARRGARPGARRKK